MHAKLCGLLSCIALLMVVVHRLVDSCHALLCRLGVACLTTCHTQMLEREVDGGSNAGRVAMAAEDEADLASIDAIVADIERRLGELAAAS